MELPERGEPDHELELTPFPCTGCSQCCRTIPFQLGWVEKAGEPCPMLSTEGLCKLYNVDGADLRPPVCDIQGVYERRVKGSGLSWLGWCALNAGICSSLISEAGLDSSWNPSVSNLGLTNLKRFSSRSLR